VNQTIVPIVDRLAGADVMIVTVSDDSSGQQPMQQTKVRLDYLTQSLAVSTNLQ